MQADVQRLFHDPNTVNGGVRIIPDGNPVRCVGVVSRGSVPGAEVVHLDGSFRRMQNSRIAWTTTAALLAASCAADVPVATDTATATQAAAASATARWPSVPIHYWVDANLTSGPHASPSQAHCGDAVGAAVTDVAPGSGTLSNTVTVKAIHDAIAAHEAQTPLRFIELTSLPASNPGYPVLIATAARSRPAGSATCSTIRAIATTRRRTSRPAHRDAPRAGSPARARSRSSSVRSAADRCSSSGSTSSGSTGSSRRTRTRRRRRAARW